MFTPKPPALGEVHPEADLAQLRPASPTSGTPTETFGPSKHHTAQSKGSAWDSLGRFP